MLPRTLSDLCVLLVLCQTPIATKSLDARVGFTIPAVSWTLTVLKDDLVVEKSEVRPDDLYGYVSMRGVKKNIVLSLFIEPVSKCKDSKSCRDMLWKGGNPAWENPRNVVLSEIGDVSCLELLVPSFRGVPVRQQNMYAEFVQDDFWVDLHISKILYKPDEHEMLERIVRSVKFEPKSRPPQKQE